ncbi:MAG: insulinase family protein [Sedimentisphaerales bacterium]|nr:insulinase family protein [Sedimentisphaerales bacterium]
MANKLDQYTLDNGMVILGERMEHVQSAAFTFLLPCGAALLPEGACGAGEVIADWILRGAGKRNSRQLSDALDALGLHRAGEVSAAHLSLAGALEASNLHKAIDLYADILLQPALTEEQFAFSQQLALHELAGLDDDPRQKIGMLVSEQFYPSPWGRPSMGKLEELQALTPAHARQIIQDRFNIGRMIFTVAGKYDFETVCRQMESIFGSAKTGSDATVQNGPRGNKYVHESHDGAQVHIGLMTETPPITSQDYYNAMAAVSVLSGSMSSRLFTEVREKRGLCYAVRARYHSLRDIAGIRCYAGTTPDKAQETLDVIVAEFNRLHEGILEEEMDRAKVGLKSTLIMQSESTISRAGGIAGDYYLLGRVRPMEEIKQRLEETTVQTVLSFLQHNRFTEYTVATIGPSEVHCS